MTSEGNSTSRKICQLDKRVYRLGPVGGPRVLSSYLIVDRKVAIIDCGPSSVISELSSLIEECGVKPEEINYLLLTHIHLDHAGGAARFLRQYPKAQAMIPERGYRHMVDPSGLNTSSLSIIGEEIFRRWGACEPVPPERAVRVPPHMKISLGETDIVFIPAPGHAPHHNVLNMPSASIVFSADSMGILDREIDTVIPTCPPPSFDFPQALEDLSTVEGFAPRLSCIAHFQEMEPTKSLFDRIRQTYEKWSERATEYVTKNKVQNYALQDCTQLFSILMKDFPEYASISPDLKEQAIRIDCAGMLDYHLRKASAR